MYNDGSVPWWLGLLYLVVEVKDACSILGYAVIRPGREVVLHHSSGLIYLYRTSGKTLHMARNSGHRVRPDLGAIGVFTMF